jgi:hypothetical protein
MGKYSEYSQEILQELAGKYSNCIFNYRLVNLSVDISVFFVLTESSVLEENDLWQEISKEIALKYQSKLESVYEKWNLYIIYVTGDKITKDLKNKIENNKFSSRKIVEDGFSRMFNDEEANRLIIKHITNTDLIGILDRTQDKIKEKYKPVDTELWKLVHKDNVSLNRDIDLQKQIVEQIIRLSDEN